MPGGGTQMPSYPALNTSGMRRSMVSQLASNHCRSTSAGAGAASSRQAAAVDAATAALRLEFLIIILVPVLPDQPPAGAGAALLCNYMPVHAFTAIIVP